MLRTIPEPRAALSMKAPHVITMQVPVDKIGEVIGPKGKRINEIIALTGADIDIQDDGTVFIGSREGEGADSAREMIDQIVHPHLPDVGERFEGTVVSTTTFGAFVNVAPGRGRVHRRTEGQDQPQAGRRGLGSAGGRLAEAGGRGGSPEVPGPRRRPAA